MSYEGYIASPEWSSKRIARLVIDGHRCRLCDENGTRYALEVHHRPSSYALIPNESIEDDLTTVCSRCHDPITSAIRADRYGLQDLPDLALIGTAIPMRKGITHGLANLELQVDICRPVAPAQRSDCRPAEQVGQIAEGDLWQTKEDRRRL